jgi:hypothetical protein
MQYFEKLSPEEMVPCPALSIREDGMWAYMKALLWRKETGRLLTEWVPEFGDGSSQ